MTYKLFRQKDGGGLRFIGTENCNYFVEALHKRVTSISDTTR